MTQEQVVNLVRSTMRKANIYYVFPVLFSNRMSSTLAYTSSNAAHPNHINNITFSNKLLSSNDDTLIRETILHECAHAILNIRTNVCHNHDYEFKKVCEEIGCTTPEPTIKTNILTRYSIICPKCNEVIGKRDKAGKWIDSFKAGKYQCSKCSCSSEHFIINKNF